MTPFFSRVLLIAKFAAVFLAPFALAIVSWELALLFPGRVATKHWHILSSLSFVIAGLCAVLMLFKTGLGAIKKGVFAGAFALVFLWFAFMFSLQSRCGGEQVFIGQRTPGPQVASCQ